MSLMKKRFEGESSTRSWVDNPMKIKKDELHLRKGLLLLRRLLFTTTTTLAFETILKKKIGDVKNNTKIELVHNHLL